MPSTWIHGGAVSKLLLSQMLNVHFCIMFLNYMIVMNIQMTPGIVAPSDLDISFDINLMKY